MIVARGAMGLEGLIAEHLDLARNIARRLGRRYSSVLSPEDIDGLGMLGLCEAAARYDVERGEPFVAFASQRIRGAVIDALRRQSLQSRHGYERKRKIESVRRAITQDGDEPTDDAVAAQLGIPEALVREASETFTRVPESEVADVASGDETPASYVERTEALAHLAAARRALAPLEATVISMRYDHGMSLALIAKSLELSTARVAKLLEHGLARMRSVFDDDR
jgi:RNA polymerase sigma factor for flagellar operon FliA